MNILKTYSKLYFVVYFLYFKINLNDELTKSLIEVL